MFGHYKITIYLKSGQTMVIKAKEYSFNETGDAITGYKFKSLIHRFCLQCPEIAAVVIKRPFWLQVQYLLKSTK